MERDQGRKAGTTKVVQVVLEEADIEAVDRWRREQHEIPARGAAIRHFIRKGLNDHAVKKVEMRG
ncbi:hypothetical protein [Azospirillum lipoferum]|uniref:hypothetical protein n=1 Tax=Azospirillum lipoferum TaxID=193 RepID=UPI0013963156|nr:hypothetical protein [Azospirillum lipoferum]